VCFADTGLSDMVRQHGYRVLAQTTAGSRAAEHRNVPPYLPFMNVERVFATAARFYRADLVRRQFIEDLRCVDEVKPDLVVIDMHPTAAIAAAVRGVPVLSIVDPDFLWPTPNAWMPWVDADPRVLVPFPSCTPAFNALLAANGLPLITSPAELLRGAHALVASAPGLEPIPDVTATYIGPLFWDPPWVSGGDLPLANDRSIPHVYISIGSGAMVTTAVLQSLIDVARQQPWHVFISSGLESRDLLDVPANVTVGGFTGIARAIAWADVVVCHGGAGTVLASLLHGKPIVVLPFMSEQEMNGRMVERVGAGVTLRHSSFDRARRALVFRDTSGARIDIARPPDVLETRRVISSVLSEPKFARCSRAAAAELAPLHRGQKGTIREIARHLVGG